MFVSLQHCTLHSILYVVEDLIKISFGEKILISSSLSINNILEVFVGTIGRISTKSESESVSVENSAKWDIGPFCGNNWRRFLQEMEVDLSTFEP